MYKNIKRHGSRLNAIFHTKFDDITLCKKLHNTENRMHKMAEDHCNGVLSSNDYDAAKQRAMYKLDAILGFYAKGIPVFINSDPRGYALKIEDEYVRVNNIVIERDLGGYGLIAPDFG